MKPFAYHLPRSAGEATAVFGESGDARFLAGGMTLIPSLKHGLAAPSALIDLGGIASLVFGVLLVIEPLIGAVVLTMWIGAYAVVFGIFLLVLAFQLHSRKEEREHKVAAAPAVKKA